MERTLRSYLAPAFFYALLLEVMIAAAILYWPDFEENIDTYGDILPFESVRKMVEAISDTGVAAYVNLQHFYKACNVLGTAAAVFFAVGAVAGEANRGALELWLSRPVSRTRMLLERYVTGALAMTLPIFLTTATIPWLLEQVGEAAGVEVAASCPPKPSPNCQSRPGICRSGLLDRMRGPRPQPRSPRSFKNRFPALPALWNIL